MIEIACSATKFADHAIKFGGDAIKFTGSAIKFAGDAITFAVIARPTCFGACWRVFGTTRCVEDMCCVAVL